MHIKLNKYIIANVIMALAITSCGGGDEEVTAKETAATPSVPAVEESIVTGDLVSTPDFNFISSAHLDVTLPTSPSTAINYFINICTGFSLENEVVNVNYDSCKLRTTLKTKAQSFSLALSAAESMVVAQIWPIEAGATPITVFWNIEESGNNWQIAL